MDAKAKTNKHKHAYFAGVGVDSFWLNNTLFRCWVPNQTDASYTWMTHVGLPANVPRKMLRLVRSLFTDDDGVVNTGIELLQEMGEIFEHANAYLCGYHIVRNLYSDFGQGFKRRFNLKDPTTKYRKFGHTRGSSIVLMQYTVYSSVNQLQKRKHALIGYVITSKIQKLHGNPCAENV
jgi:hypothetical protein